MRRCCCGWCLAFALAVPDTKARGRHQSSANYLECLHLQIMELALMMMMTMVIHCHPELHCALFTLKVLITDSTHSLNCQATSHTGMTHQQCDRGSLEMAHSRQKGHSKSTLQGVVVEPAYGRVHTRLYNTVQSSWMAN